MKTKTYTAREKGSFFRANPKKLAPWFAENGDLEVAIHALFEVEKPFEKKWDRWRNRGTKPTEYWND